MTVKEKPVKRRKTRTVKPQKNNSRKASETGNLAQADEAQLNRIESKLNHLLDRIEEKGLHYISPREYMHRMPVSYNTIIKRLNAGEIRGAFQEGGRWHIPWPPQTTNP